MLFNSIEFVVFFIVVFSLYWLIKNKRNLQNLLLLISSYIFYGAWDWRFLFLIFISSLCDYLVGLGLAGTKKPLSRKLLLFTSIVFNIGTLGFFKYFNFFTESFHDLLSLIGFQSNYNSLKIILPVGISFYTFQTLSYSIDIYKKKITPSRDAISFFAYVSFFPQLVAGPIERAANLLPQFMHNRSFDYKLAVGGLKLILWGLLKKVVIADNCAEVANYTFSNFGNLEGSLLFFGAFCFAFQIYGDFSGYSDIAIGTARMLGFDLMRNFAFPYFSKSIKEFWQRWHISLSTWFKDYVYIPLGGSYVSVKRKILNILTTFLLSGFWHGANWTFIAWGAIHGILYIPGMFLSKPTNIRIAQSKIIKNALSIIQVTTVFIGVVFAWIFFRADSISDAIQYIQNILTPELFSWHKYDDSVLMLVIPFIIVEFLQRKKEIVLDFNIRFRSIRWIIYLLISLLIFNNFGKEIDFIYFQF